MNIRHLILFILLTFLPPIGIIAQDTASPDAQSAPTSFAEVNFEEDLFTNEFWQSNGYKKANGYPELYYTTVWENIPWTSTGWYPEGSPKFSATIFGLPYKGVRIISNPRDKIRSVVIYFYRMDDLEGIMGSKKGTFKVLPKKTKEITTQLTSFLEGKLGSKANDERRGISQFYWKGKAIRANGLVWWMIEEPGMFVCLQVMPEKYYTEDFSFEPSSKRDYLAAQSFPDIPDWRNSWITINAIPLLKEKKESSAYKASPVMRLPRIFFEICTTATMQDVTFNMGYDIPAPLLSDSAGFRINAQTGEKEIAGYNGIIRLLTTLAHQRNFHIMERRLDYAQLDKDLAQGCQLLFSQKVAGFEEAAAQRGEKATLGHMTTIVGKVEAKDILLFMTASSVPYNEGNKDLVKTLYSNIWAIQPNDLVTVSAAKDAPKQEVQKEVIQEAAPQLEQKPAEPKSETPVTAHSSADVTATPAVTPYFKEQSFDEDLFTPTFWNCYNYGKKLARSSPEHYGQPIWETKWGETKWRSTGWNVKINLDEPATIWGMEYQTALVVSNNKEGVRSVTVTFFATDTCETMQGAGSGDSESMMKDTTERLRDKILEKLEKQFGTKREDASRGFSNFSWRGQQVKGMGIVWWVIEEPGRFVCLQATPEKFYRDDFSIDLGGTMKERLSSKKIPENALAYMSWKHVAPPFIPVFIGNEFKNPSFPMDNFQISGYLYLDEGSSTPYTSGPLHYASMLANAAFNMGLDIPWPLLSLNAGTTPKNTATDEGILRTLKLLAAYKGCEVTKGELNYPQIETALSQGSQIIFFQKMPDFLGKKGTGKKKDIRSLATHVIGAVEGENKLLFINAMHELGNYGGVPTQTAPSEKFSFLKDTQDIKQDFVTLWYINPSGKGP